MVRLGRVGLHLGSWTSRSPEETTLLSTLYADGPRDESVRLIDDSEMDAVNAAIRNGWQPPVWHYRWWLNRVLPTLHAWGFVTVDAFAAEHWHRPPWLPKPRPHLSLVPQRMFDPDIEIDEWEAVPAIPHCGKACSEMHTYEPPCLWAREYQA